MTCDHVVTNDRQECDRCHEIVDTTDAWDGVCRWCDHGIDWVSGDRWSFRDGLREVTTCAASPHGVHVPSTAHGF